MNKVKPSLTVRYPEIFTTFKYGKYYWNAVPVWLGASAGKWGESSHEEVKSREWNHVHGQLAQLKVYHMIVNALSSIFSKHPHQNDCSLLNRYHISFVFSVDSMPAMRNIPENQKQVSWDPAIPTQSRASTAVAPRLLWGLRGTVVAPRVCGAAAGPRVPTAVRTILHQIHSSHVADFEPHSMLEGRIVSSNWYEQKKCTSWMICSSKMYFQIYQICHWSGNDVLKTNLTPHTVKYVSQKWFYILDDTFTSFLICSIRDV